MKCLGIVFKQKFAQRLLLMIEMMWCAQRCNRKLLHVPFLLWKNKMLKSNSCQNPQSNIQSLQCLPSRDPLRLNTHGSDSGVELKYMKVKKSCSEKPVLLRRRRWELYLHTAWLCCLRDKPPKDLAARSPRGSSGSFSLTIYLLTGTDRVTQIHPCERSEWQRCLSTYSRVVRK